MNFIVRRYVFFYLDNVLCSLDIFMIVFLLDGILYLGI